MGWKMRGKVGPSRKWYRDAIEEVSRDLTEGGLKGYEQKEV